MKQENKLASWTAQLRKLKDKRKNMVVMYQKMCKEFQEVGKKIVGLNVKISNYNKADFHLSDHFILRFKERVTSEISIPEIKLLVFTERNMQMFRILGDTQYPIIIYDQEYQVILKNKTLITILNNDEK
jgi:hypothetical protein